MSKRNPPFNTARGAATMTAPPPFDFEDVILRVFPLRADIHALRLFCDRFLNVAPEFALFEPAAPYVFLEAINYGRMSPEASNFGWVSQNEVAFAVLLNWYRIDDHGEPVFHDIASVCPFIFVDDETSVRGGREVFGWPKSLSWLTPGIDAWARDPRSPRTLFTLSAMVFPELFAGRRQEARVLFEIEQEPSPSAAEFPVNPFNELNPLVSWPRTILNSMRLAGEMAESLVRLPIRGFPLPGIGSAAGRGGVADADFRTAPPWEIVRGTFGNLNPFAQLPAFNTINLKQFRDCAKPEEICYQALVNAKMTAKAVKRGGLLGQQAMALGDPSGGYSLKFHRYPAWPIIESLGLEVEAEGTESGRQVATLKPILPNWVETDFHYGSGEVLCWRSRHTHWAPPPRDEPPPERPRASASVSGCAPDDDAHPYNTAQGGSLDQVTGPFHFQDVTLRVLPLLADPGKLQAFCDDYLNHRETEIPRKLEFTRAVPSGLEAIGADQGLPNNMFRAWGRYVYLIVTNYEEMTSELNVGWWAQRQVAFAFPVKWYRRRPGSRRMKVREHWHLVSTALVSPFIYADSSVAATTGRELQGKPVVKAEIESPPSGWLEECGPVRADDVLRLRADVFPALNVNQEIETRTLVEITGREILPPWDEERWSSIASGPAAWGETLVRELQQKQDPEVEGLLEHGQPWLKGLALELLSGRRPINHISLKQFRDAEDPTCACYQAITLTPETLELVKDLREIDQPLHVAIHRYPSQPIVKALGLRVKWKEERQSSAIDYLQPIRPFWLRADVKADLGHEIFWRAGRPDWVAADDRWTAAPGGAGTPEWRRRRPTSDTPPLFFERTRPAPFGREGVVWVESEGKNRRDLRNLRSERMTRLLEEWKRHRPDKDPAGPRGPGPQPSSPEDVDDPASIAYAIKSARYALGWLERTQIEPQLAVESILSKEWLHFGRPRWERRQEARVGEFDRHVRELVGAEESRLAEQIKSLDPDYPRFLEEELEIGARRAPPLKRDFIIRQDTIGHPSVRRAFERAWSLQRLDDDYWYLWPEEDLPKRLEFRQELRRRVWKGLRSTWRKELEDLRRALLELRDEGIPALREGLGEGADFETLGGSLEKAGAELDNTLREVEELLAALKSRMDSAEASGDFEREYQHVQGIIHRAREMAQEAVWVLFILGMAPEEIVRGASSSGGKSGEGGESGAGGGAATARPEQDDGESAAPDTEENDPPAAAETEEQPIPLKPGIINKLGEERLKVLAQHNVTSVQDLAQAKNFRHWFAKPVSVKMEVRMRREAQKYLADKRKQREE